MARKHLLVVPVVLASMGAGVANADTLILPRAAATTAGPGGYSTLLNAAPRSYQLVVGPAELVDLPVGSRITGIAWRRPTWQAHASWPGVGFNATFQNFDITLSSSNNPPGSLSRTYTDNIGADAVMVRGGTIAFNGPYFPGGAVTPATNPFCPPVFFTTPYVYNGGSLLLTVRHTGNNVGASGSLDTVSSAACEAIGVSSYTQADDWYNQGPIVMQLTFEQPGCQTPVIDTEPLPGVACPSGGVQYTLAASGPGPLTYSWEVLWEGVWDSSQGQDGCLERDDPFGNLYNVFCASGTGTPTLTITDLNMRYVTSPLEFRCQVTNACGSVWTEPAVLVVCVADFNCSGATPDDADVAAFFIAWNNGEDSADVNNSGGTPDDADIAYFFQRWNEGC